MKLSKVMALAGVTLLASGVLAACSGSGSSAKGEKTFLTFMKQIQTASTILQLVRLQLRISQVMLLTV